MFLLCVMFQKQN